jgi:hypothetical protein
MLTKQWLITVSVAMYPVQKAAHLAVASATTDASIQDAPDVVDSHAYSAE